MMLCEQRWKHILMRRKGNSLAISLSVIPCKFDIWLRLCLVKSALLLKVFAIRVWKDTKGGDFVITAEVVG